MTLDIGYHVMSEQAVKEHGRYDDELSIVEFLRRVYRKEEIPLDVTVTGLHEYLAAADDPRGAAEFIHQILRDRVNFILNQSPVIQFIVDDIEHWDGGQLPISDENVRLVTIFGGSLDQEASGWYAGEFNVQS